MSVLRKDISLLFDEYKESTTAFVSTTFATIPWILFGVSQRLEFAGIAMLLHILPPLIYHRQFGPFGIKIDCTPTKQSQSGREPDKASERKKEAVLNSNRGTIFVNIDISKRLEKFEILFEVPDEIEIELRDVPRREHTYYRERNILACANISQYKFSLVLELYVNSPAERRREYPLKFVDNLSGKDIKEITLIDS